MEYKSKAEADSARAAMAHPEAYEVIEVESVPSHPDWSVAQSALAGMTGPDAEALRLAAERHGGLEQACSRDRNSRLSLRLQDMVFWTEKVGGIWVITQTWETAQQERANAAGDGWHVG